ncbi:MAG: permease prefix domain 1-containing protein [Streptosporangiaceae bacterium]|jgi:hypothetical protein
MNRSAGAGSAVGAGAAVESYLAEIAARLPGPARDQVGIVAELRSGLLDAADAHAATGLPAAEAALAAVLEFGDPGRVAAGFGAEIATRQARRVAVTLLVTGPLVGLLWVATALASHLGIPLAPHWPWAGPAPGLRAVIYLVAVAAGVTAWAAVLGIATTGRLTRWRPARPRQAPMAAAVAGFGAVGADGLGLALLAAQLATAPGRLSPVLAGTAAAASLARMMLARRGARRCLAIRASLT